MDGKLFIYNVEDELRKNKLVEAAEDIGFEITEITIGDLDEKIGYLVGIEGYEKSDKEPNLDNVPDEEMLLFVDVGYPPIKELMERMAKENYRFPHKAALTETTKNWTFKQLVNHIKKENQIVTEYSKLINSMKYALGLEGGQEDRELKQVIVDTQALKELGETLSERHIRGLQVRVDEIIKRLSK